MANLIEGYEYDIFISYRQKDNKYDGWVTEFVNNLKKELEATFKEEIIVYFDINPHDGLLETHDVNASLKDKLNCLVFIPIISRTYCDPKSYAWNHEFKAFVEQASKDQFGLKVTLSNGNVASRVLPVRIHDIDFRDNQECESVLGGPLRGVEFIYKSPGVNRPLRSKEDNPNDNLNKTFYRDQINKVALAIKEIIFGLKREHIPFGKDLKEVAATFDKPALKEKSIIVLPFENLSPDPDQEYFSDGLTEEIITDLSHIHDLLVISRSSAMTFKGTRKTIPEIAQTVNVRYILEGSVRKAGNNLRITAQLIDALTDTHLWADMYSGTLDDVFDIQEKVARTIVNEIQIKLTPQENAHLAGKYKVIPEAYEAYMKGRHEYANFTGEGFNKGIEYLKHSIILDPYFPPSYTSLSSCYAWFGMWCLGPANEVFPKAREAAMKAIQLDANLAEAHASMGVVMWEYDWNWQGAETEFRISINLNPNSSQSHNLYSNYLLTLGHFDEAIKEASLAMELDPTSSVSASAVAYAFFWAGRYKEAITRFENILEKNPNNALINSHLAHAFIGIGNIQEAMVAVEKARRSIAPGAEMFIDAWLAGAYISLDKPEEAEKLAEIWENQASLRYVDPGMMPCFYLWLGKKDKTKLDKAFEWMKRGLEEHSPQMVWYKTSPLRPLPEHRFDSRWIDVLQKIGFKT